MFKATGMKRVGLGGVARAVANMSLGVRMAGTVLIAVVVAASVAGFVSYQIAEGNGYDRGYEVGKSEGFTDGKQEGLAAGEAKRDEGYRSGYAAGESAGYDEGYDVAMQDAIDVVKRYLPSIIQQAYNNGRASAPVYVPSFDFGNIHCTSYDIGSFTNFDCY